MHEAAFGQAERKSLLTESDCWEKWLIVARDKS